MDYQLTWTNVRKLHKSKCVSFISNYTWFTRKLRVWVRQLVVGLSSWRLGFSPGSIHVGFLVDIVAVGQVFSSYSGFPCQYHSTVALHTHASPGEWTRGPLVAAAHRHSLTPSTWKATTITTTKATKCGACLLPCTSYNFVVQSAN
jgi:hypothetical protein